MAVHLHLTGISFRRGFHAGGGDQGDDLSGGCREAQGAPIALHHVQVGGRAAGAGRLVGIQLLNLVVQLARTSGDGGFGMAVRTLEGDGTARGSFDGDLSGFGIAGGAPFEGMLVAQGDGREGGRFGKGAEKRGITSFTSASGIALAHFKQSFAVVGSIRVAAEEMGGVLAAIGLFDVFVAITGTGAWTTPFLRLRWRKRRGNWNCCWKRSWMTKSCSWNSKNLMS